jgi:predicted sulfurtransferase
MSILDDIAADLMDERQARAELRADESTLRCGGCKRRISVALLVSCLECGKSVCATCDPSCPHTPDPDALRREAIKYTIARAVRRGL